LYICFSSRKQPETMATDGKPHLSIVICGHVDSGKSTTTGRLIFELGGLPEREMIKLQEEADRLGKGSFAFAFFMDRQKEERERGVTISCTTKEFFTDNWHYTIIDAPGHKDFIKNMISGAAQADVALLMVPADGNFITAIQKGNRKAGEVQGQTRQHARLINLLGVKQLIVGINKMDTDTAGPWGEARYKEIKDEMINMLKKVGWKGEFIDGLDKKGKQKCKPGVPFIPMSGFQGDNLIKPSSNMSWFKGEEVSLHGKDHTIKILLDALNDLVKPPERDLSKKMRMPVSGIYKIKGVGDVITGRIEQGEVNPKKDVFFLPTHTTANPCKGTVFTLEMHHKRMDSAGPGDNVGLNMKGLDKQNMPRAGDVMIYSDDETLKATESFVAQVQTLDIPSELKEGYSPIGFVRCGRASCRLTGIDWKMGKETGGKKLESPHSLKSNEMAQVVFTPQQPLVTDSFKNCEGLARIAFLDGNTAMMLGRIVKVNFKTD